MTGRLPGAIDADWAWGGSQGAGVRVAVIDSGIDVTHPAIGSVAGWADYEGVGYDGFEFSTRPHGDHYGHGTACASIIRRIAPAVEIYSVRVLGPRARGRIDALLAGVSWALDNGMDVVNLSVGTRGRKAFEEVHELADRAYFKRVMIVSAASNFAQFSSPSSCAAVISVAAHPAASLGADRLACNPEPPVEFYAPGRDIEVALPEGGSARSSGNSFAAPYVTGLVARILSKHPGLTPFEVKAVLAAGAE